MTQESDVDLGSAFAFEQEAGAETDVGFVSCAPLKEAGFIAAFSSRLGGTSAFTPGGLSLGYSPADSRENVDENRRRFLKAIGAPGCKLITARQTHSADRCVVEAKETGAEYKCDALLARAPGVLLGIQTADCLPVLIADPKTGAVAAIHAGWRGTADRITERAIADLMRVFGVNPRTCVAALGPAACVECYEVGPDVIDTYKRQFGYWKHLLRGHGDPAKAYLDIHAANIQQMMFCGIGSERIHTAPFCTMHNNDLFFSHRKESQGGKKQVGRLLSVIAKAE
ncbi:MAG TPA: peptidoglycan editing factor PgeF [Blastocatellia bacterium]